MLQNYMVIYEIAQTIQALRARCELLKMIDRPLLSTDINDFKALLGTMERDCLSYGLNHTAELVKRVASRPSPETHRELLPALNHLNDSLTHELEKEAVFRVPLELKKYYEQDDLFGQKVAAAFPSCDRDIRKAGSCYALEQEDACVHHLMLVLERGLNALAARVGVSYQRTNWQTIIDQIASKLKSAPRGPERDFFLEVNAQFGFLKDAYRNHSEHARDDHYDMPKALSILNHAKEFMEAIEKGGLKE